MNESIFMHYDSLTALRSMIGYPWVYPANQREARSHLVQGDNPNWHGIAGGAAAVIAATENGYPEGEAKMRAFMGKLTAKLPRAQQIGRVKTRGPFGDELDIHAVNRGQLDRAWTTSKRTVKTGSNLIRLCIDICGNSGESAESLAWRGVAGLALADVLHKAGYSVEIVAVWGVAWALKGDRRNVVNSVCIKPYRVRPDYGMLAALVCLPGFFRSLGFAAICRAADANGRIVQDDLGKALASDRVFPAPLKTVQLFVPSKVENEITAREWMDETLSLLQKARG
jgi:hypothetical protein